MEVNDRSVGLPLVTIRCCTYNHEKFILEHKHFEHFGSSLYELPKTVISKEFSTEWRDGMEPYYPVNDETNAQLYNRYRQLAMQQTKVLFGGRLAEYKYYDMAPVIEQAFRLFESVS